VQGGGHREGPILHLMRLLDNTKALGFDPGEGRGYMHDAFSWGLHSSALEKLAPCEGQNACP
jgi:hypothetical protein